MSTSKYSKQLASKRRYWSDHVAAWSGSGLSQAEYCRRHVLAAHRLSYWAKKLTAIRSVEVSAPESAGVVELVEVDYRGADEDAFAVFPEPLRVVIGERFRIEICGDFDAAVFEKLALTLDRLA